MSDTRTLKLSLLADVKKFTSGMEQADKGTKNLNSKIRKYSKAMAASFAVVGAAAGAMAFKIGVDSVKAAIEDQKSQRILALQMKKTLGASDALIASTEQFISQTQLRVGVQDDKLRPSLARLIRSTDDAVKAQDLLNLALDISVATGKPLEAVSNALGKAYDGNVASLSKLGLGLDANVLKGGDFNEIGKKLKKTYGGFANQEAKSLDGQLRITAIRFDELKESIGTSFLPILGNALIEINKVALAMSGNDPEGLSTRARELKGEFGTGGAGSLGFSLVNISNSFTKLFDALTGDSADKSVSLLQRMADAINLVASAISLLATAYSKAKSIGGKLLDTIAVGEGPAGYASSLPALPFGDPNRNNPAGRAAANGGTTIIMNGVIDGESARRSIQKVMQDSSLRTSKVNLIGSAL
jgi:hypothetical protein